MESQLGRIPTVNSSVGKKSGSHSMRPAMQWVTLPVTTNVVFGHVVTTPVADLDEPKHLLLVDSIALNMLLPDRRCCGLECGVRPDVSKSSYRVRVKEQPKSLAGFDFVCQKRVNDSKTTVAWADSFEVAYLNESNVLARREGYRCCNWRDGDVDCVTTSVAILD